eukprot:TRINITY_DN24374_c0_g2_i2.p1 TRINITY_DN24374_c0_g2~~TRINITY_DN24374_c0_g2_i2.p1  ORF type:complete len:224 (+),score=28.97 TRINITY_DN24374_c0_g2_i2:152-823(+)
MSFTNLRRPATTAGKSSYPFSLFKTANEPPHSFRKRLSIVGTAAEGEQVHNGCEKLAKPRKIVHMRNVRYKGWQTLGSLSSLNKPAPSPCHFKLTSATTGTHHVAISCVKNNDMGKEIIPRKATRKNSVRKVQSPKEESELIKRLKIFKTTDKTQIRPSKKCIKLSIQLPNVTAEKPLTIDKTTCITNYQFNTVPSTSKKRRTVLLKIANLKELSRESSAEGL